MSQALHIAQQLVKKPKRQPDGSYMVPCPAHKDRTPSLALKDGDNGYLISHCFAGCDWKDVRAGLEQKTDLVPFKPSSTPHIREIAFQPDYPCPRTHIYRDKDGTPQFVVERRPRPEGGKTFKQHSINGHNMEGVVRLPYNFHHWHNEDNIIIIEGEQGVEVLNRNNIQATCNPGGAGNWQEELNEHFKDKHVIIIPDNDEPGRKHAEKVTENLQGIAATVTTVDICQHLNEKDDIVQWLQRNDIKHLIPALNNVPIPQSTRSVRGRGGIQLKMDANWTIRDILPATGMVAAFGPPGSGKTFWMLDMAMHIAAGVGYNGHTTKHGPVLYIPLEGGAFDNRVIMWCQQHGLDVKDVPIYISDQPLNLLDSDEDLEQLIQLGKDIEAKEGQPLRAVITDTLSRAMAGGNENEPQAMTAVIGNGDAAWKALNTVFVFVHHTGKDATRGLRGHSSLHGAVDTMIEIKSLSTTAKSALIAKQRNGEDGMSYGFSLEKVDIGNDTDGEMLTTCTVSHLTATEFSEIKDAGFNLNPTQRLTLDHFDFVAAKVGQKGCPEPDMPMVVTVLKGQWGDRCRDKGLSETGTDEAEKKAFNRAVKALKEQGVISQLGDKYWRTGTAQDNAGTPWDNV